ncbi:MAG: ribosome maturation factor RimP [Polyangiaceae bacterium]
MLSAHAVDAVELVWRTDRTGWVLELTIERPEARLPGEGVTLDLCSEISRDLSAALDVADAIPHRYRLEVGSPGLERALYTTRDYARFAGQSARLKLKDPIDGQHVLRGLLQGLDEQGKVLLDSERGELLALPLDGIESARLVFQMGGAGVRGGKGPSGHASGRGARAQRPQR